MAVFDPVQSSDEPPFPEAEILTNHIWPAASGRETLRRIALAGNPELRRDAARRPWPLAVGAPEDLLIYEVGMWCLKTSRKRRYTDPDVARRALIDLVHKKASLGRLLPRRTVLCLQRGSDGAYWLWTACPWLGTLESAIEHAVARDDERQLAAVLERYAGAAIEALAAAVRSSVLLDVHPSNFADPAGHVVYLDDDIAVGERSPTLALGLLATVVSYAAFPLAVERYVDALVHGLSDFGAEELARSGIVSALSTAPLPTVSAAKVQRALLAAIERAPRGAR